MATFGQGGGPIALDYLTCTGGEARLIDCLSYGVHSRCTHAHDAGVRCSAQTGMHALLLFGCEICGICYERISQKEHNNLMLMLTAVEMAG